LAVVKTAMEREGAVGLGYFGYGFGTFVHGQGRYDLYLSRFPDQRSMERQWQEWTRQSGGTIAVNIGDEAIWLPRSAADHDHRLFVRKGLYLVRLECTANQQRERLIHLARMTLERISQSTE
jgi:hypothetical protein